GQACEHAQAGRARLVGLAGLEDVERGREAEQDEQRERNQPGTAWWHVGPPCRRRPSIPVEPTHGRLSPDAEADHGSALQEGPWVTGVPSGAAATRFRWCRASRRTAGRVSR